MSHTIKGPEAQKFDGSDFRIAIVHARWNSSVIDALVAGAVNKLKESGVKDENIVVQSVPGSFELPLAAKRCFQQTFSLYKLTGPESLLLPGPSTQ